MLRKLGIEPGEGRVFAWSATALFLLGWADVSVKNVSEAFFIKRVGVDLLPYAFLVSSVLLVGTTWAFGNFAATRDRLRLLPRTFFGLGLLLLPLWALVQTGYEPALGLLLVASKQITSIALLVFWLAMGDLLHGRQTKRLFAPLMAGVTVGMILGSFASEPLGRWLGTDALLLVSAFVMMLGAAATLPLRRFRPRFERAAGVPRPAARPPAPPADHEGTLRKLWGGSVLFRFLLVTAFCSGVLGPMLYWQFQYVADLNTAGEDALLAFYARFKGWVYGGVLVTQLLVSGRLYRRIGVPLSAAFSPIIYLVGFMGLSLRLSLPVGIGAKAGTQLQDNAIYDPAVRVLCSLFPEEIRARATAMIEGPVKRGGGAIGNSLIALALAIGTAPLVGYVAMPVAGLWLLVALVLWRRYPRLLLDAAATRKGKGEAMEGELLDPATVRALVPEMCSPDHARARLAVELVADAEPVRAVAALADAAARASQGTRHLIVAALDRRLEAAVADPLDCPEAAGQLEGLLENPGDLSDAERADLVQAYARLQHGEEAVPVLERAFRDPARAVQLVALAALARRDAAPAGSPSLDTEIEAALAGDDPAARRAAREELRSSLICGTADDRWLAQLKLLVNAFAAGIDRAEAAEALAEVAARHGGLAAEGSERLIEAREDPDTRVRVALIRWAGYAARHDQLPWLVQNLASDRAEWSLAAKEALIALGPASSNALLRELSFGKRSKRDRILEVMRELDVRPEELRELYELELDAVERDLSWLLAIAGRPAFALLTQRLEERVREELHTALLFLASIRHQDDIVQLGVRLQQERARPRQRAIVVEALESLLPAEERQRLLPLIEDADLQRAARGLVAATRPSAEEALHALLEDPEKLTRTIAVGLAVAAGLSVEEHEGVDAVEKMLHLKELSLFEDLTARQLMDLATLVKETVLEAETVVVEQGQYDDCLYLVGEGVVHIKREDTMLAELGPGDFFGEIALFEGVARSADAVTRSRARLLGLERADLMALIEDEPGIAVGLLQTLSRRVRELTDRLMV